MEIFFKFRGIVQWNAILGKNVQRGCIHSSYRRCFFSWVYQAITIHKCKNTKHIKFKYKYTPCKAEIQFMPAIHFSWACRAKEVTSRCNCCPWHKFNLMLIWFPMNHLLHHPHHHQFITISTLTRFTISNGDSPANPANSYPMFMVQVQSDANFISEPPNSAAIESRKIALNILHTWHVSMLRKIFLTFICSALSLIFPDAPKRTVKDAYPC